MIVLARKVLLDPDQAGRVVLSRELSRMSVGVRAQDGLIDRCPRGA